MNTSNSTYSATARNATRLRWSSRLFLFLTVIMLQAVAYGTGGSEAEEAIIEEAVKLLPPATTADSTNTSAQDETQKALLSGESRCSQDNNHNNGAETEGRPGHANIRTESTAARSRGAVRDWFAKHKCTLATVAGAGTAVALSTIVLISQHAGVSLSHPPAKSKASASKALVSDQTPFDSTTQTPFDSTTEATTELSATDASTRPAKTTAPPPWWEKTSFPECAREAAGRQPPLQAAVNGSDYSAPENTSLPTTAEPPITTTLAEKTHTSSHQTVSSAADSDESNEIIEAIDKGYSINNGDFISNRIIPILDVNIRQANSLLNQAKAQHSALSAIHPAYGMYNYEIINDIQLNNRKKQAIDLAARATPDQLRPTWAESHKVIQKQISDLASAQYTADRQYITLLKAVNTLKDAIKDLPAQMMYELSADEDDKISKSYISFFYIDFFNYWNSIAKNITQDLESLEGNKLFNTNYLETLQLKYSEHFKKYTDLYNDFYNAKNALYGDNTPLGSWGLVIPPKLFTSTSTTPSSLITYLKCNPEDFLKRYTVFISDQIRENGGFTGKNHLKLMASNDNNQFIIEQASDKDLFHHGSITFEGYCFSVKNSVDDDYFTHWGKIRYIDIPAKAETGTLVFIEPMTYGSLLLTEHSENQLRLYYHPNDIPDYSRYKNRVLSWNANNEQIHKNDTLISYPLLYKAADDWQLFVKTETVEQVENIKSSPQRNKRGLSDLFDKSGKINHIHKSEMIIKEVNVNNKVFKVPVRKAPVNRVYIKSMTVESYHEIRTWAREHRINLDVPKDKIIGARASSAGDIAGSSSRTFAYEVAQGEFKNSGSAKTPYSFVNSNRKTIIIEKPSGGGSANLYYSLVNNDAGQGFQASGQAGSAGKQPIFGKNGPNPGGESIGHRKPVPLPKPSKAAQWGNMGAGSRPHYESIKLSSAIYESIDESKLLPNRPAQQPNPKKQGPTFVLSQAEQQRLLSLSQSRSPAGLGKKPAVLPKSEAVLKKLEARCRRAATGGLCSMSKKGQYNDRLMPRKLMTRQDTVRFTQTMPQRTGVENLPNDIRAIKKPVQIVAIDNDYQTLKIGAQIKQNMQEQGVRSSMVRPLSQAELILDKMSKVNTAGTHNLLTKIEHIWHKSTTSMKENLKIRRIVKTFSAQKIKPFAYINKLKQVKELQMMSKVRNVKNLALYHRQKASMAVAKLKGGIVFAAFDVFLRGMSIGYRIAYHNSLSADEQDMVKERFATDVASMVLGGPFALVVGFANLFCPKHGCDAKRKAQKKNIELINNAVTVYTSALEDNVGITDIFNIITKTLSGPPVSFVRNIFKNNRNTFNLYAIPVKLTGDAEDRFIPYISLGDISTQQLFIVTTVNGEKETLSHVGLGGDIATLLMDKFYGAGINAAKQYQLAEKYARKYIYDTLMTEEDIYSKISGNKHAVWANAQCKKCTGFNKIKTYNARLTDDELKQNAKIIYNEHAKWIRDYFDTIYPLDKMDMLGSMHSTFLQTMQINIGRMANLVSYPPKDYDSFTRDLQPGDSKALESNRAKVTNMVKEVNNDYNSHCLGLTRIFMDALIDNREWATPQNNLNYLWGYNLDDPNERKELTKKFRYPKITITPKIIQPGVMKEEEKVTDIQYGTITKNTNIKILNIINEKRNSTKTNTNKNQKNIVITLLKSPEPPHGSTTENTNTNTDNVLISQKKKLSLDEFITITKQGENSRVSRQMQINAAIQSSPLTFSEGYAFFEEKNEIYNKLNLLAFPIIRSIKNKNISTVDLSEASRYGCYITKDDKVAIEIPFCEDGQDESINLNNTQLTFNIDSYYSNPVNITNLVVVKHNSCYLPLKEMISGVAIEAHSNNKGFKISGINRYGSYSIKDINNDLILAEFQVMKKVDQPREKPFCNNHAPGSICLDVRDINSYQCPNRNTLKNLLSDFSPGSFKYAKYQCKNGWCKPYALNDFTNLVSSVAVDDESDIGISEERFLPHLCDVLESSIMPGSAGMRFQPYIRNNKRMALSHYLKLPIYQSDGTIIDEADKDLLIERIPESLEEGITEETTLSVFSDDTIEQLLAEEGNSEDSKKTVRRSVRSSGLLVRSKEANKEGFASSSSSSAPNRTLIGAAAATALLSTGAAVAASDSDKEDDDDDSGAFHWNSFKTTGLKALYFSRHGSDEELEQKRLIVQNWVLHRGSDMAAVNRAVSEEAALVYRNADLLQKSERHPVNSRDSSTHHTCLSNAHDLGYAIADNKDIQVHIEDEKQLPDFLQADITRQSIRNILMYFDIDSPIKDFLELLHTISEFSLTEESDGEERSFLVGQSPWFAILDRIASFEWYEKNIAEGVYKQQPTCSVMGRLTRMASWLLPSFVFKNHNNCASINHVLNRIADSFPEMTIADLCQARLDNIMNSDASHIRDPGETIRKKLASLRVLFDIEKFIDSEILLPKIIMDENHIALKERCGQVADPGYRVRLLSDRQTTKGDATVLLEKMPGGH